MPTEYLPLASAFVVAICTFLGNYWIGRLKNKIDIKTISNNASDALRDDLLQVIDRYEKREQFLVDRIDKNDRTNEALQITIAGLRSEISVLRQENQALKAELQQTRRELEQFERKVYFKPPTQENP